MRRTVRLEGGGELSDIPARDIARCIDGIVHATARAAGYALGARVRPTGRWRRAVERAADIRLVELMSGSAVLAFESAPDITEALGLPWHEGSLNERALAIAVEAAGEGAEQYPDVAAEWVKMAVDLEVGKRYDRIVVVEDPETELVRVNKESLKRLRMVAGKRLGPVAPSGLQGRLYEANFDARTAQLKGLGGEIVRVEYPEELADDIYEVLRGTANLAGEVTFSPETMRANSIKVSQVNRPVQLALDEFWESKPIAEIATEAGIHKVEDQQELVIAGLSPADWAELREAMRV
jgi:hypothetical protein